MKYLIVFLSIFFFAGHTEILAQEDSKDVVTEKMTVSGACSSCKKRIEKAAYIKGVKRAEWNKMTKELTVTYKPSKVSKKEIAKALADVGHDSEFETAPETAYSKLPACCNYRTGTCED